MNGRLNDEFIARRCEEVLDGDPIYQGYNKEILTAEKEFKATLTPEQLKMYDKIEEIVIASIAHSNVLIYQAATNDKSNKIAWDTERVP